HECHVRRWPPENAVRGSRSRAGSQEFLAGCVPPALGSRPMLMEMTFRARPVWSFGVLGLLWIVGPPSCAFGATSTQKCAAAKLKAFGAAVQARAECQAEARAAGGAVNEGCVSKVEKKLAKRLAKADAKGPCPGDAPEALLTATACVTAFDGAITGTSSC